MRVLGQVCLVVLVAMSGSACSDEDRDPVGDAGHGNRTDANASEIGVDRDSAAGCEDGEQSTSDCYVGLTFAKCPGSNNPRVFCTVGDTSRDGCLWISNGRAMGPYIIEGNASCRCTGSCCTSWMIPMLPAFFNNWGPEPWNETRHMNVALSINEQVVQADPADIQCSGASGSAESSFFYRQFCNKETEEGQPLTFTAEKSLQGELIASIRAQAKGMFVRTHLDIEVDLRTDPGKARACRVLDSDALNCPLPPGVGPECAQSGTIRLNKKPAKDNLDEVFGEYQLNFPDGLTIAGHF